MTSLKDRIMELIKVMDVTQRQFAEMTEISPASLSSIINDRTNPTLNHVYAITGKLPYVNPSWLLTGQGDMFLYDPEAVEEDVSEKADDSLEGSLFAPVGDISPTPAAKKEKKEEKKEEKVSPVQEETKASEPIIKEVKVVETRVRQITEIRIFYDDQTWETFIPKSLAR